MLVQLRLQPSPEAPPGDAFQLLLACHERMRTFSALAVRLARLPDVPPSQRAEAAGRVERYFSMGLPLHVEDEEHSLSPRLREVGLSPEALQALDEMTRQHEEIEAVLATLLPTWRELRDTPERYDVLKGRLEGSEPLAKLLEAHLQLEERVLFPEARARLTQRSLEAFAAEVRARRGQHP